MTSALFETEDLPATQAAADRIIFHVPGDKNILGTLRTSSAKPIRPGVPISSSIDRRGLARRRTFRRRAKADMKVNEPGLNLNPAVS